jgi:hypothetical protein
VLGGLPGRSSHALQFASRRRGRSSCALAIQRVLAGKVKDFLNEYCVMDRSRLSGTEIEEVSLHSNLVMAYEEHDESKGM